MMTTLFKKYLRRHIFHNVVRNCVYFCVLIIVLIFVFFILLVRYFIFLDGLKFLGIFYWFLNGWWEGKERSMPLGKFSFVILATAVRGLVNKSDPIARILNPVIPRPCDSF
jgi:hypothetical protein